MKITVMQRANRRYFEIQWRDPVTERLRTESTGTDNRRDAERYAARRQVELEANDGAASESTTWAEFRTRVLADYCHGKAKGTQRKIRTTLDLVKAVVDPKKLIAIREPQLGKIKSHLRGLGRSEFTTRGHLAILRTLLGWAVRQRMLPKAPHVELPPEPATSDRGRAITGEELDRLLSAVPGVVGVQCAPEWQRLLTGLWLSGLRVEEAYHLTWDNPEEIMIEIVDRRPLLRIPETRQKNKTFTLCPITPDFWKWLIQTPEGQRRGWVFRPTGEKGGRTTAERWSKVIVDIGKAAGVKVGPKKFASAHDLRRAFGERWCKKYQAATLMKLMRHKDVATTLKFYAKREARAVAEELWQDAESAGPTNTSTNSRRKSHQS